MGCLRLLGVVAWLLMLVAAPSATLAQASPASELLDRGVALRRSGEHAGALELFERAYALEPSPRALAQIGLAEHALAHWRRAYEALSEALVATQDAWIAPRRALLESARTESRARLGEVFVDADVSQVHATVEVWVAGERRGELPLASPLLVEAGRVEIELRLRGAVLAHMRATVERDSPTRAAFGAVLAASEAALPASTSDSHDARTDSESSSGLTIAAWSLVGVSAASLGVGIGFHVAAANARDTLLYDLNPEAMQACVEFANANGTSNAACFASHAIANEQRSTYMAAAIAGDVVAGLSLGTAIALFIVDKSQRESSPAAGFACGPAFTLGAQCAARF